MWGVVVFIGSILLSGVSTRAVVVIACRQPSGWAESNMWWRGYWCRFFCLALDLSPLIVWLCRRAVPIPSSVRSQFFEPFLKVCRPQIPSHLFISPLFPTIFNWQLALFYTWLFRIEDCMYLCSDLTFCIPGARAQASFPATATIIPNLKPGSHSSSLPYYYYYYYCT